MSDADTEAPAQAGRRKRGRPPTEPCGTRAAWRRHKRAGEQPCDECVAAISRWNAAQYRRRTEGETE